MSDEARGEHREVGGLDKDNRYRLLVVLAEWHSVRSVDLRLYVKGSLRATSKGFGLAVDKLPALIGVLQDAHREAQRIGWLEPVPAADHAAGEVVR